MPLRRLGSLVARFAPHRAESAARRVAVRALASLERITRAKPWDPGRAEARFAPGSLYVGAEQVMQDWEAPLMRALAAAVTETHGDVLEIGFGLGLAASEIQRLGCRSHTIVEANPEVLSRARTWQAAQPSPVTLVFGRWQERLSELGEFDGILFDTHPASWAEHTDQHLFGILENLRGHLREGGALSYFHRYGRGVPLAHQSALLDLFDDLVVRRVRGLSPPPDCDYWREDSMMFVTCHRRHSS
jgi:protein-L-isoaspartate O-methyltransferase